MASLKKPKMQVNTKALAAVGAGLLAFAAAGYLLVISPQRAKAKDLTGQIVAAQQQLSTAQLASRVTPAQPDPRVDELFRLTRAMPATTDMAGILLELSRVAEDTGITFNSITPAAPTGSSGYQTLPIEVTFAGNYYELSDFIFRLNNLVAERDGKLNVNGRLFTVNSVDFSKGDGTDLGATISTTAYIYGAGSGTPSATAPATPAPATPAPATPAPATPPAAATPTAGGS